MEQKPCPKFQNPVSTKADACPKCGYSLKNQKKKRNQMGCLIFGVLFIAFIVALASNDPKKPEATAEQTPPEPKKPYLDSRTGRPVLDYTKPIIVIKGADVCTSEDELNAARKHAPNMCIPLPLDLPVVILESHGFLEPVYRVRFIGMDKDVFEGWVRYEGLRN